MPMTILPFLISLSASSALADPLPATEAWPQCWIEEHPPPREPDALRRWLLDQAEAQPATVDSRYALRLPVWPSFLKAPCTLSDRACLIRDGYGPGSLAIDPLYVAALRATLELADAYVQKCQERIDLGWAARDSTKERLSAKVRDLSAEAVKGGSFQDWMVVLMVVGSAVVSAVLGYGAYAVIHRR